jgi:hypothetical protein
MNTVRNLFLAFLLILSFEGTAQVKNKVGTSGFQFLKMGVGARETALGESATALAEGPAAIYWNVAGLTNSKKVSALFFHNPWIATIQHSYIAISVPVSENNAVGVALTLLSMDDMEETTIENPQGTGRRFGAGDIAISLSYAQKISDRLGAGISVKYINEYIWDLVTDGWALDIGLQYKIGKFSLGMAVKDFGTDKQIEGNQLEDYQKIYDDWETSSVLMSLVPKEIRLPVSFHFGAGYELLATEDHSLETMVNLVYFNDIGEVQNAGLEYTILGNYSLRAGYRFNRDAFSFTGGFGIKTSIGPTDLQVDFAALQMDDFGYRTQFNIIMSF